MTEVVEGEVLSSEPAVSVEEQRALEAEQSALDMAILRAQVDYLTQRVAALARENARIKNME